MPKKIMNALSRCFINGMVILIPLFITYFVIATVWSMMDKLIGVYLPIEFPGMGLVFVTAIILLVGAVSSSWISRRLLEVGENFIDKIPIVKFIYSSAKRLSDTIFRSGNMFEHPVLIPYPHPGVRCLGFITTPISKTMEEYLGDTEYVSVFIPWSLNMTSGFNVFVPREDVTCINITKEEALQYVLTAGAVMPDNIKTESEENGE